METRDIQKHFGIRVKALRKAKGLTQEQLAEAIGKSVDTVSNIERGFSSTRIKTAEDIARILDVTVAELFHQIGENTRHQQFLSRVDELTRRSSPETLDAAIQAIEFALRVAK